MLGKAGGIQRQRGAHEQGLVAAAAVGLAAELRRLDAVGGVAVGQTMCRDSVMPQTSGRTPKIKSESPT